MANPTANAEAIRDQLVATYDFVAEKARVQRAERLWIEIPAERLLDVIGHLREALECGHLCTITGLDEKDDLVACYHLARPDGLVINVKARVQKALPVLPTITGMFPGGELYERELMDLLGFQIQGLPPGNRYPLTDDFPKDQFPLRKDWKPPQKAAAEEK